MAIRERDGTDARVVEVKVICQPPNMRPQARPGAVSIPASESDFQTAIDVVS
jgi:hypothetical protein